MQVQKHCKYTVDEEIREKDLDFELLFTVTKAPQWQKQGVNVIKRLRRTDQHHQQKKTLLHLSWEKKMHQNLFEKRLEWHHDLFSKCDISRRKIHLSVPMGSKLAFDQGYRWTFCFTEKHLAFGRWPYDIREPKYMAIVEWIVVKRWHSFKVLAHPYTSGGERE